MVWSIFGGGPRSSPYVFFVQEVHDRIVHLAVHILPPSLQQLPVDNTRKKRAQLVS